MKYSFQIDTGHLSYQYNGYYEDFDVELSDEQFEQLCITLKRLWETKELYSLHPGTEDHEWWLHKYHPDILKIVRDELEIRAPQIWDSGILPELYNVDIYVPDEAWCLIPDDEEDL